MSKGKAKTTCVTKGANNFRDSEPSGDDAISGDDIKTGSNGVCNTTANSQNLVPVNVPTAKTLRAYLNDKTWGNQANVHFTVTRIDSTVNYDLDRSRTLAHPVSGAAPNPAEGDAISAAAKNTSTDYNIYYVRARDYSIGTTIPSRGETWTAANGENSPVNHTAHEVGHLLGILYESENDKDLMLYHGSAANPCRVVRRDWRTVNLKETP